MSLEPSRFTSIRGETHKYTPPVVITVHIVTYYTVYSTLQLRPAHYMQTVTFRDDMRYLV